MPRPVLREEYHPICRRPCEWIGFSFSYPEEELRAIKATGANMLTLGAMWIPVQDDSAPYGCGFVLPDGAGVLAQTFTADAPFDALAPCLPTGLTTDSGCAWRLFARRGEELHARLIAQGTWNQVVDNSWPEASFPKQPAGEYCFEVSEPTGTWIGWWARPGNPYADGQAYVAGDARPDMDLELRLRAGGQWRDLIGPSENHMALPLGPGSAALLAKFGFHANYAVGDWNNPGFPYLPDWFNERFPEALALDQHGQPFLGGMFGKAVPAPGIESPVLVDGGSRFIRATVRRLRADPTVLYWVMGGEALYATYCAPSRWTDYSDPAIRHFRAWLEAFRYRTVADLNRAWGTAYVGFAQVDPPRQQEVSQRWLDWLDFRFASMAERFAWHYRAARSEDAQRLIVTCNHGSLYADNLYAAMGARPELYAANSDGFETGQIMTDGDPELYNIMYLESLNSLGKPYCPARLAYKKSAPQARGGGTSYTPEAARRYVYESLGGDAWHLGLIQWSGSLPDGEWGVAGTPAEKEIARLFGEVRQLWPLLDDMHAVKPALGVFLSHPTWALRGWAPAWTDFHVMAVEHQMPKLYIYDEQVKSGQAGDFATILSLDNTIVAPEVLEPLLAYVRQGGRLVIAGRFADEDTNGAPVSGPTAQLRGQVLSNAQVVDNTEPETVLSCLIPLSGPYAHLDGEGQQLVPSFPGAGGDQEARSALNPIRLTSSTTTLRQTESLVAPLADDWPQDMREAHSLGQTLTVPREGLRRLEICTPTYLKTPEYGFRLEVLRDGPEGEVMVTRDIPGGIGDNSWQAVEFTDSPSAGTRIYVRATADERLPRVCLGWWSTHQDSYPQGTAYVDDQPVPGDRRVRLLFEQAVPATRQVEAFVLSDGLNFSAILINIAPQPVDLGVDLQPCTEGAPPPGYEVTCPLVPEAWKGEGLAGTLALPAHGATMLYVKHRTSQQDAERLVEAAQAAYQRWQALGADTPFIRYAAARAQEQLHARRPEKAAAMALQVLSQIGLQATAELKANGALDVRAIGYQADGSPVMPDCALCELVPTPAFWRRIHADQYGALSLELRFTELPHVYDYARAAYVPFHGPLRINLSVRAGPLRGQAVLDLVVPGR